MLSLTYGLVAYQNKPKSGQPAGFLAILAIGQAILTIANPTTIAASKIGR
jgi:hypothetical protein